MKNFSRGFCLIAFYAFLWIVLSETQRFEKIAKKSKQHFWDAPENVAPLRTFAEP